MPHDVLLLPGDGIGPEVVSQARRVLEAASKQFTIDISFETADLGGVAIDNQGVPYPTATRDLANKADAILLGAVGALSGITCPPVTGPNAGS